MTHPLLQSSGATRVEPGQWVVTVPRSWGSWSGPLGGLLNAIAARAATDLTSPGTAPMATHTQFVRKFSDAPVSFTATVERAGGTTQFVTVRGTQDEQTVLITSVVCGRRAGRPVVQRVAAPVVPPPEECQEIGFPPELVPFGQRFEIRQASGAYPMSGAARAEMGAWLRLRPEVPTDALIAIVMMDAMPPGLYPTLTEPAAIVSAELSVHLHRDLIAYPVDGFALAVQRTVTDGDGWCVDEADLWDRDGGLIAQSRQQRRILALKPG
ncbi:acyl-CoA thioesterase [Amycolatopsis sp. CA-230715]|uniref:acyl-CoA thioesterase n=1 Tax=Amycolatopsis sp. CA-230715 TaxID=2745196 RepID=UPI001C038972|nr:thioesterase family protein [Amycolatopsis sp. CA-230715]QWF85120.1 hypothetical protein HUW46_08574 [Amycolatopsis sp. CA-230715]